MNSLSLFLELRRWRAAGQSATLWWRDDDAAGSATTLNRLLLERLLQLSAALGVPVTLAVVPVGAMVGLRNRLETAPLASVVQHGVDHQNRRTGPAAGEFAHDLPLADLDTALRDAWERIKGFPRATKLFVPPWNDIHPQLERALAAGGYAGLSASGELGSGAIVPRRDVHLDLMRWRGGARFRGRGKFLSALARELRRRRKAGLWTAPIGLLTHHRVHDTGAWTFLGEFLRWTKTRPDLAWAALPDILEGRDAGHERSGAVGGRRDLREFVTGAQATC